MSTGNKISTGGGAPLGQRPFAHLPGGSAGEPMPGAGSRRPAAGGVNSGQIAAEIPSPPKNRGRVDITRQTAGRGGKTVTVASGFIGIGQPEKEQLAKKIQKACGAGGTVKDGCIEIQGDKREQVARILAEAGFRPVFAGG